MNTKNKKQIQIVSKTNKNKINEKYKSYKSYIFINKI